MTKVRQMIKDKGRKKLYQEKKIKPPSGLAGKVGARVYLTAS